MKNYNEFDDIYKAIKKDHIALTEIAKKLFNLKDETNLYSWKDVAQSIINNIHSCRCKEGYCKKCGGDLVKVLFQYKSSRSYKEIFICPHCMKQYDENMNLLYDNRHDIAISNIQKINASLFDLICLLKDRGYNFLYRDNAGEYGYLLFEYKGSTFGIWIDTSKFINIFYPNWALINESELNQELIFAIQSYILNTDSAIYWLYDNNNITLSSNISLDSSIIKKTNIGYIEQKLEHLFLSKNHIKKMLETFTYINILVEERFVPNRNAKVELIIQSLLENGCENINIDDDGDINFIYNDNKMFARILSDKSIRLVFHSCILQDITEDYIEDVIDRQALSIQWNNMIYPIKCTFYKPNDREHSITAIFDIELHYFENKSSELVKEGLDLISNHFDTHLFDLLYGTEKGIELIHTYYQPSINNF